MKILRLKVELHRDHLNLYVVHGIGLMPTMESHAGKFTRA